MRLETLQTLVDKSLDYLESKYHSANIQMIVECSKCLQCPVWAYWYETGINDTTKCKMS